jgi:virginiamycin A acetyltransferase
MPTYKPFAVVPAHIEFLKKARVFIASDGRFDGKWFKPGYRYAANWPATVEPYCAQYAGLWFAQMGAFSYCKSNMYGFVTIGRYCAIADRVQIMPAAHTTDRLSTCGFDVTRAAPYGQFATDQGITFPVVLPPPDYNGGSVEIGDDVWIATDVKIARKIKIGTGAIIAAGSVVTRDVEPYTMVAGNPARPKKRRFSDALCERLLASEWWRYAFTDFRTMSTREPDRFLGELEERIAAGTMEPYAPAKIALHDEFQRIAMQPAGG